MKYRGLCGSLCLRETRVLVFPFIWSSPHDKADRNLDRMVDVTPPDPPETS
jgi:hypothetical protein